MIDYKALIANLFKAAGVIRDIEKKGNNDAENASKIYCDQPIVRRSSENDSDLPAAYREMRKIANSPEALRHSESWLFYQQGKFIERIIDNKKYTGSFVRYNPTYQLMTNDQLRGYVTWRTGVREGHIEEASFSFAYVYVYELLNLIGVKDATEGFEALCRFREEYCNYDALLEKYLDTWICDFAAYYGIDPKIASVGCSGDYDVALITLKDTCNKSDKEIFDAICQLSSYRIGASRFAKEYTDDVMAVCRRVYEQYSEFYSKNRKRTLFEVLFGSVTTFPYYRMFSNAVFYSRIGHTDHVYEINPIRRYTFSRGIWSREMMGDGAGKSSKLGEITKSIDSIMRVKYGYKHTLKYECPTKQLATVIEKVIDVYIKEKREAEREAERLKKPEIVIDLSRLAGIRSAADITRDRLIIDEPEEEELAEIEVPEVQESVSTENEAGLEENEFRFLYMLLYGGDYVSFVSEKRLMMSVLVDSVNEKLYEILCDTAIEFDGETPILVSDYIDELKGLIK